MKSVVIIKVNQLGDSVLDLPLVEAVIERVGRDAVHVITTPIAEGLYENLVPSGNVLAMTRTDFNDAWKHPTRLLEIFRWIWNIRPEAVVLPLDQGKVARFLARVCGADAVIEMVNPLVWFPDVGTFSIPLSYDYTIHENNWRLFQKFAEVAGWSGVPATPPRPMLTWGAFPWDPGADGPVLIHPGSSRVGTRWGIDRFCSLAMRLAEQGTQVLWIPEGEKLPPEHPGIRVLDRRPLMEFARTVATCRLFIGNNSGPMHLCDAMGVPMVVLCGPVGPEWDPYWTEHKSFIREDELDCQPCESYAPRVWECPRVGEPFACMVRPGVERVMAEAMKILKTLDEKRTAYDKRTNHGAA